MTTPKLKLNLQDLDVATFESDVAHAGAGTVQANEWAEEATPKCTGSTCETWCAPYC